MSDKPIHAIVPVRLAARRFPRKALELVDGQPLLRHLLKSIQHADLFSSIVVASEDEEVTVLADSLGIPCCTVSGPFRNGSQRVAKTAAHLGLTSDHIVNIQGDMLGVERDGLALLVRGLRQGKAPCYSLARQCKNSSERLDRNRVKVVISDQGRALYFSRLPIPHGASHRETLIHVGVYAFRGGFIERYAKSMPSVLGVSEDLEQLDWMAAGHPVQVERTEWSIPCFDHPADMIGVNAWLKDQR